MAWRPNRDGPAHHAAHMERVLGYIEVGRKEGAELLCGGQRLYGGRSRPREFCRADGFSRRHAPDMRIVREEIFGPSWFVQLFDTEEEAVRLANDTVYGLAAGVFTSDGAKGLRVLKKLSRRHHLAEHVSPDLQRSAWGGYKQSGWGRELGTWGLDEYLETSQININLTPAQPGWFKSAAN